MTPSPLLSSRLVSVLVTAGALLVAVTTPAPVAHAETGAPTPRRLEPVGGATYWHGGPGQLPNHPGVTEEEILAHAFTMPAVQELLAEAERRGYVRHPNDDRGFVRSDPRMVGALLSFEKPGLSLDGEFGAPLLSVTTVDVYGTPRTAVSLMLVLVDEATGAMRTADDEPSLPGDGTIEYMAGSASGGGSGLHMVHPQWNPTPHTKSCTRKFLICSAAANFGCVIQSLYPPEPPQIRVLRIALCAITVTVACIGELASCLDTPE